MRRQATNSVAKLELSEPAVLAALSNNLGDDIELLGATLEALETVGPKASSLAATISQLVEHPVDSVRQAAINTYAAIQSEKSVLTGRLIDALEDKEWTVRKVAAERLAEIGPEAKAAVPKLFALLGSEDDSDSASNAIREIDAALPKRYRSSWIIWIPMIDAPDSTPCFCLEKLAPKLPSPFPGLKRCSQRLRVKAAPNFARDF